MNRSTRVLMILLAIGIAAGSGCVYWRLLKFKGQLNNFNEHFEFVSLGSYSLILKHPLLTGADFDQLMEVEPSEKLVSESSCQRIYRYEKDPPDQSPLLVYSFHFEGDLLTRIDFPEQFNRLYPGGTLPELLQAFGSASVDRDDQSTHSNSFDHELRRDLPDLDLVMEVLGEPSDLSQGESGNGEELIFRYRLQTSTTGKNEEKRRAAGVFFFDAEGELTRLDARIGKHEMRFDIPDEGSEVPIRTTEETYDD